MTLPFFGGGKLVWWKAVNFFDETGVGRHASVKEALESLQPDLEKVDGTSVHAPHQRARHSQGPLVQQSAAQARPGQIFRPFPTCAKPARTKSFSRLSAA